VCTAVEVFEVIGLIVEVVRFLVLKSTLDPILEFWIKTGLVGHVPFPVGKSTFLLEELCDLHEFTEILT
jgi:hypothetical protein